MPTLFPHIPSRVTETLEFNTDVRRAFNGELRDSLKPATQRLICEYVFKDEEALRAEMLFRNQPAGEWYVPVWSEATRYVGTIASGAGSISSVEDDADYRAAGRAAIVETDQKAEVVTTASISGGTLTLTGTTSQAYTGTQETPLMIAPVRTCYAPNGITIDMQFGITTIIIEFLVIEPLDIGESLFSTTLDSIEVVTDVSFVNSPLAGDLAQALELIDNGFGAYSLQTTEGYQRRRSTLALYEITYANRYALKKWLHYIRGKDRPFWLPTWKNDLTLNAPVASGSNQLATSQIVTDTPSDFVDLGLYVTSVNGNFARTITNATNGASTMTLTLNTTHGISVPSSARLYLMHRVRFDTDRLELIHQNSRDGFVTSFSAPVIEVVE